MYTADYTIALPNGSRINLLFNSWAYREYCRKLGIEYEDLLQSISEGQAFRAKNLPNLLLTAAESFARFNKHEFVPEELTAFEWIDALGGFNAPELMKIYKIFVSKLLNVSPEQFDILWNKAGGVEEKKDETPKKKTVLPGRNSTSRRQKQGSKVGR